ncbi:hypothetical protein [Amycolatopsis sp. NPDC051061]|uniref:hypothetical protein n=1 Tax=Amycolatopsis sp. NPDC051061 TaxID=3155042 RepID=UPI0034457A27
MITAPFDGQARSSLGGSLISAGGIGGALFIVEVLLDRRQLARERVVSEALRVDLLDGANAIMASSVRAHCELLWSRLVRNLDADLDFPPEGWWSATLAYRHRADGRSAA